MRNKHVLAAVLITYLLISFVPSLALTNLLGKRKKGKAGGVGYELTLMGKSEVWGQLRWMQNEYSWSDGRTGHAFRDIFGVWPNSVRHEAMRQPSMQLRSWIRARAIAYAKAKQAAE